MQENTAAHAKTSVIRQFWISDYIHWMLVFTISRPQRGFNYNIKKVIGNIACSYNVGLCVCHSLLRFTSLLYLDI